MTDSYMIHLAANIIRFCGVVLIAAACVGIYVETPFMIPFAAIICGVACLIIGTSIYKIGNNINHLENRQ